MVATSHNNEQNRSLEAQSGSPSAPANGTPHGQQPHGHRVHYAFVIVGACTLMMSVMFGLVYGCTGIFYAPVCEYFGFPRAQFVLYFSIFNLAITLMLTPMGRLMTRLSHRALLSVCAALVGLSFAGMGLCNALWQFYICGAVMGIGMTPFVYLVVPTYINAWFAKRVGFFVGLCLSFTGVIGIFFNPIVTSIIASSPEGWRHGYMLIGAIVLVVSLPITLFVLKQSPAELGLEKYGANNPDAPSGAEDAGVPASRAMKMPSFYAAALFCAVLTILQTMNQYMPGFATSLASRFPDVAAASGFVASFVMAGCTLGTFVVGILNDRSIRLGTWTMCVSGICGLVLLWFGAGNLAVMFVGAFLFGVLYGGTSVEPPLLTRACFGSADYTILTARISTVGAATSIIFGFLWGLSVDSPLGYAPIFVVGILAAAVAIAAMSFALARRPHFDDATADAASPDAAAPSNKA